LISEELLREGLSIVDEALGALLERRRKMLSGNSE